MVFWWLGTLFKGWQDISFYIFFWIEGFLGVYYGTGFELMRLALAFPHKECVSTKHSLLSRPLTNEGPGGALGKLKPLPLQRLSVPGQPVPLQRRLRGSWTLECGGLPFVAPCCRPVDWFPRVQRRESLICFCLFFVGVLGEVGTVS